MRWPATRTSWCGHDVLCNSFRNPAHLAKMAATAQAMSGGRVVVGIGAGWNEEEYRAYGWDYPSARVRIEQLAESIQVMRAMWTDAPAIFEGKHYRVDGAYCEPRPDRCRRSWWAAQARSICCAWWRSTRTGGTTCTRAVRPTRTNRKCCKRHCRDVGRDYDEIVQVLHMGVLIAESEAELKRMQARDDVRPVDENTIAGTPEQVTEYMLDAVEQGAQRITVHFADAPRPEGTWLFAATVLPHLAA